MGAADVDTREAWTKANQRYITARARLLRARLAAAARRLDGAAEGEAEAEAEREVHDSALAMPAPSALDRVASLFDLSPFQCEVLVLAAAVELMGEVGGDCARLHGDPRRRHATFGLALWALPGAHWSAITPDSALRRWRLVEVEPGTLSDAPLRIDERILHELVGVPCLDERLRGLVALPPLTAVPSCFRDAAAAVERVVRSLSPPAVVVTGGSAAARGAVAGAGLWAAGTRPLVVRAAEVPAPVAERELFATLVRRELLLREATLMIERSADDPAERAAAAAALASAVDGPVVIVAGGDPSPLPDRAVRVELPPLGAAQQRELWADALGPAAVGANGLIAAMADEFRLPAEEIARAGAEWRARVEAGETAPAAGEHPLRCRVRALVRLRFEGLARVVTPAAAREDLVLPPAQAEAIRQLEAHVRHQGAVLDAWGFAKKERRGNGIVALFHGPSGTGKTLAAEVVAGALGVDLVCVDLSQVVSKYIGETEKHLARVFDAAERGGVALLFDEADALFGKRSEVKDSHDRYANIEVGYLLQRLESFRGLAVLTSNLRQSIDAAFLRRLRFVVAFPFPGEVERREIWRRALPPEMPTAGVDVDRLARLQASGGSIRNIALHAAFFAVDQGSPLRMEHLQRAARDEFARAERSVPAGEIGGWA